MHLMILKNEWMKMDRLFNLSQLHKNASSEDLKQGSFGIEWEGLRLTLQQISQKAK